MSNQTKLIFTRSKFRETLFILFVVSLSFFFAEGGCGTNDDGSNCNPTVQLKATYSSSKYEQACLIADGISKSCTSFPGEGEESGIDEGSYMIQVKYYYEDGGSKTSDIGTRDIGCDGYVLKLRK